MAQFTRPTIVAAGRTADRWYHSTLDSFLVEHGLEDVALKFGNSVETRANLFIRHLVKNPDATTDEGENLVDAVVRDLVERAAHGVSNFPEDFPKLARALARDGFVVQDGKLRKALPATLGVPQADDEVHDLLKRFDFTIPLGHLDQAIDNHSNGNWAAANGQIRSFLEGLVNETAEKLARGTALPAPGGGRLNWLATKLDPPFVLPALWEWDGQGRGLFEALYRRLQPQGPHPGLSDEEDSTFRLHTVLVAARLLLRRLAERIGP